MTEPGRFDGDVVSVTDLSDRRREQIKLDLVTMMHRHFQRDARTVSACSCVLQSLNPKDDEIGLVALKDGSVRGGALVDLAGELRYLGSLQNGAGRALLRQAEQIARDHGATRMLVAVATDDAMVLARRYGYRREGCDLIKVLRAPQAVPQVLRHPA